MAVQEQTHARYEAIFAEVEAPFAFVDLDAMGKNAEDMVRRAGGKPIRVASKSVRCRPLLDDMGEFVGDELLTAGPGRIGQSAFEEDVAADGERLRGDRFVQLIGLRTGVDLDVVERRAEG
jgi:hypothetical protein